MRWHILNRMPWYSLPHQPSIIMACFTLHNFIGTHNSNDAIFSNTQATEPEMSEHPFVNGNDDEASPSHAGELTFQMQLPLKWAMLEKGLHKEQAMWANAHGYEVGDN
jgi:hypothetical protein